ncbi:MAG: 3-hydroxyacyl-ACP dehydratase FabZ [Chitinivibrionales bacterium]
MFDIEEIMRNVPHRYPFLLIDRVTEFEPNQSVTVLKNITINEAHFQGHFPKHPVFPGVYIVENMAQASCFLLAKSAGGLTQNTVYYLGKISKISFRKPVVPGDQLVTKITVDKIVGGNAIVSAKSFVDDEKVASGSMMFAASRS